MSQSNPIGSNAISFASIGLPSGRRAWGWAALMAVMIFAGGANPYYPLPRAVAEMAGAIMIASAIASVREKRIEMHGLDWLAIAAIALPLIQLIPLPPSIWSMFPGRAFVVEMDRAVFGSLPWRPISLTPERTMHAALTLIPPIAVFAAVRTGTRERVGALMAGVIFGIFVAALMAMLQKLSGLNDWTFPYSMADRAHASAFFTNHNHLPTFLIASTALASGWLLQGEHSNRPNVLTGRTLLPVAAMLAATVLASLLSGSRAGLAILILSSGLAALLVGLGRHAPRRNIILGVVAAAAMVVLLGILLKTGSIRIPAFDRFVPLLEDKRFEFWPVSLDVARTFFPIGSGLGSFSEAYAMLEPREYLGGSYINHAHDDYLELIIEAGLPAAIMMIGYLAWFLRRGWRIAGKAMSLPFEKLAFVSIFAILVHSLVDYPMRTSAIAAIFALATACLVDMRQSRLAAQD